MGGTVAATTDDIHDGRFAHRHRTNSDDALRTRHGYDLVAADYAAAISGELLDKPLDRALLDVVVEAAGGDIIADIGCGPGHVAGYLTGRGARVLGMDLPVRMCAVAGGTSPVPFAAADMRALPVRSHSPGAVVSLYAVI